MILFPGAKALYARFLFNWVLGDVFFKQSEYYSILMKCFVYNSFLFQ